MAKARPKTKVRRARVHLGLKQDDYKNLGPKAQAIYDGLSGHPALFSSLTALLAVLLARIQAYTTAQQQVRNGQGTAETRNLKATELCSCLEACCNGVQQLCDASPEQAAELAAAACMKLRKPRAHTKQILSAVQVGPGTTVHLAAYVGILTDGIKGTVLFRWQITSDGGKTWLDASPTPHGHTDVVGLTAMQTYGFRVGITSGSGDGEWSQVVSLVVT